MNPSEQPTAVPRTDLLTVAAISIVVFALATVLHEGLGHGGVCLLVGGTPQQLSSMDFDSDTSGLPDWTNPAQAAAAARSLTRQPLSNAD